MLALVQTITAALFGCSGETQKRLRPITTVTRFIHDSTVGIQRHPAVAAKPESWSHCQDAQAAFAAPSCRQCLTRFQTLPAEDGCNDPYLVGTTIFAPSDVLRIGAMTEGIFLAAEILTLRRLPVLVDTAIGQAARRHPRAQAHCDFEPLVSGAIAHRLGSKHDEAFSKAWPAN